VPDGDSVGGRAESGFGHADHRDGELGVRVRAQAGPATWIEIGVATGHQQAQPGYMVQHGAQRWQLPQVELAKLVGQRLSRLSAMMSGGWS
jgi:hypothetical protein